MDVEAAAAFLSSVILYGLGFCGIAIVVVFLNNIFVKYWKPVQWFLPEQLRQEPPRFAEPHELPNKDIK